MLCRQRQNELQQALAVDQIVTPREDRLEVMPARPVVIGANHDRRLAEEECKPVVQAGPQAGTQKIAPALPPGKRSQRIQPDSRRGLWSRRHIPEPDCMRFARVMLIGRGQVVAQQPQAIAQVDERLQNVVSGLGREEPVVVEVEDLEEDPPHASRLAGRAPYETGAAVQSGVRNNKPDCRGRGRKV